MGTSGENPAFATPSGMAAPRRAHPALRVVAGIAGLFTFAVGGLFTLGTALGAPLGMGAASWFVRRRGIRLTRRGSWLAAVVGAALVIAILSIVFLTRMPGGFFERMEATNKASESAPRPAWLDRIARPDPTTDRVLKSRPFMLYTSLLAVAFISLALGIVAGTVGWGSTLLLGYAFTGRWPVGSAAAGVRVRSGEIIETDGTQLHSNVSDEVQ